MKKFLKKLFVLSILFYALSWCVQGTIDYGLKKTDVSFYENWNDITSGKVNSDVIIMGSSRALRHIDPAIIETKLGLSAFNLGGIKLGYDTQKIKYNAYLQNNTLPKIAIINVDINSLDTSTELFNKQQYLPYYSLDNFENLREFDDDIVLEYVVPLYKYRGFNGSIKNGLLSALFNIKPNSEQQPNGYAPKDLTWQVASEELLQKIGAEGIRYEDDVLEKGLEVLKERISNLKKRQIEVFLVWTPEYVSRQELEEPGLSKVRLWYTQLAEKKQGVYFIDFTTHPMNQDKSFFYNSFHLNKKGATLFTRLMSDSIAKYTRVLNPI